MTRVAPVPAGADDGMRAPTRSGRRLRPGTSIAAAVVMTLIRPASWAYGLLGFLAGGGLVIVAWPILVLPTPTGLQNDLGVPVSRLVLGTPSIELFVLAAAGLLAGVAVLVVATLVGAWAERQGIVAVLEAARREGLVIRDVDVAGAPGVGRIALIRLLALVPVAVAVLLAWGHVYDAAYHELILPDDLVTPLPIRVIRDVPGWIGGVGVVWLLADTAAAVGVRRLVLERRPVLGAWLLGWVDVVRRPHRVLATALAGLGVLVLLLGPVLLASAATWGHVSNAMLVGQDLPGILLALTTWVAVWLGGLVLVGVAAAIRAAGWTLLLGRPPWA